MRNKVLLGFMWFAALAMFALTAAAQDWNEVERLAEAQAQSIEQNHESWSQTASVNSSTEANIAIPPGTRILAVLVSPLHSTSGTEGSGVYLETVIPVIQDNRVVIPAHTFVQGTVEGSRRPGHFNRTSEFRFRFSSMIFPNNAVAPIDAMLQSIPGSRTTRTNQEGRLMTVDQPEKALLPTVIGATGGAIIGSVTRFGIGKFVGAGLGAGLGLGSVVLQRGDEINLPQGTHIEIALRTEITLTPEQAKFNASYAAPPPTVYPAPAETAKPAGIRRRRNDFFWPMLGALLVK